MLALLNELGAEFSQLGHRLREASGLGSNDLAALRHIVSAPTDQPLGVGDIAERLKVTSGAATGIVDRLERAGHLVRVRDAVDRRRVYLRPTDQAHELAIAVFGGLGAGLRDLTGTFDDPELDSIERFLAHALAIIAAHREQLASHA